MGVNSGKYEKINRECTLWEALRHPFAIGYKGEGSTLQEAFDKLVEICDQKNFGEPQQLPDGEGYYCGISKKTTTGELLYNKIFMGYDDKKNQYVVSMWWTYLVTKRSPEFQPFQHFTYVDQYNSFDDNW